MSSRREVVAGLMYEAQRLGYSLRYWWLSEAMELQGSPDRLIVCVHRPTLGDDAGMDLYNVLSQTAQMSPYFGPRHRLLGQFTTG